MINSSLNERQARILLLLAAQEHYVTFSTVAEQLELSSRTIIRELDDCDAWLRDAKIGLDRKAGQGLRLQASADDRRRLMQLLNPENLNYVYNNPDRLLFIRQSLLRADEPIKLFTLARQLKVAEGTISSDLSRVDHWFDAYGLLLKRKPGLGIFLEGTENSRRRALQDLLHEVWNENSLIEMMLQPAESSEGKRVRALLQLKSSDFEKMRNLIQIVEVWEKQNQLVHRERSFLNMVLHLIVLTWRQNTPSDLDLPNETSMQALALANSLLEEIAMTLSLEWLPREVPYLAHQLPVLFPEMGLGESVIGNRRVIDGNALAREMISLIQSETGYAIHDEDILVDALATHLQLAATRLQFGQMIHNPLEKEIRENYPQWFELASKCAALVSLALDVPVPDAETAYLTLYLGAVMEKAAALNERRYHIAVLCPIGMSSSVLLASRVESIFPQVTVDAIISFKQAPEIIQQQRFDLILSTADIALPGIPVLTVRPFFPEADQEKLRQFFKTVLPRKVAPRVLDRVDLLSQLGRMNDLVSGLFSLLSNFFCTSADCTSLNEVIQLAAAQILPENPSLMTVALEQRESIGHVVIDEKQIALLHARTSDVTELHFGLIKLAHPIEIDGSLVKTVLVMAAPLSVASVKLDIMRLISRSIVDDDAFSEALGTAESSIIYQHLERLFKQNFPLNPAFLNN
ncbi:MAG: BglG family transcription antiterminator [Eubacteriales bacterium]|nr:BglG family transcription antiterminator [Eubacteriales bacterium]